MRSIAQLFGKSPFGPLQEHMKKSKECVDLVRPLFEAVSRRDTEEIQRITDRVSKLEHEADVIKNEIRDHLPRTLFMPVGRSDFFSVLSQMDSIPDTVEDLCVLLTLRKMTLPQALEEDLRDLLDKSLATFYRTSEVFEEVEQLLGSPFGGSDNERVFERINEIGMLEWETDKSQFTVVKHMFDIEDQLDPISIFQWSKILQKIGDLANFAEKTADRLRALLSKG
jgi:predicted phosphate transport protein (TIGR00153 family)